MMVIEKTGSSIDFHRAPDLGTAIVGVRRPFLVVSGGVRAPAAEHILIGSKDAREVRLAIRDALPFLNQAKRVTVIEICESDQKEAERQQIDNVVLYLARHKVRAEGRVETRLIGSGADQIVGFAENERADLLEMGIVGSTNGSSVG